MEKKSVVILGSGITGLATAYYLKKSGFEDFVILERFLEPGGLCRSITKEGFTWDLTGHVLWRMDPETRKFYDDVLGDNLTWVDRKAAVYTNGTYVPYPYQFHLKHLPPEIAYECMLGFLQKERYLKGIDFESWSLSTLGEGIHRNFMVPFNEKLFGVPLKEMTNDWVQDIPSPTLDQILRGAILGETFNVKGNAKFGYPKVGGMQALVNALIDYIGVDKILTGRAIHKVDVEKKEVTHRDWSGNNNAIQYDKLVSTITLPKLLTILEPNDSSLRQFSNKLKSNSVACVMMGFEKSLTDLHWLYVPESKYSFYRIGFTNNLVESVAPPGCGSITAEITIPEGGSASTDDFVTSTLFGLRDMGLLKEGNAVLAMHTEFIAPAYVIYDLIRKNVPRILDGLKSVDVHSVGRYGAWYYSSVSDNVAEARLTARGILKQVKG